MTSEGSERNELPDAVQCKTLNPPHSSFRSSPRSSLRSSQEVVRVCGCDTAGNDVDREILGFWSNGNCDPSREAITASREAKIRLCGRRMWDDDDLAGLEDYVQAEEEVELHSQCFETLTLTRPKLEMILETNIFPVISKTVQKAFKDLDVDQIILLGGGSHLLKLEELIKSHAPRAKVLADVNPFTPVSIGACIRASVEAGGRKEWEVKRDWGDVVPFDLGVGEGSSFVRVVEEGSKTPVRRMIKFDAESPDQPGVTVPLYEKIRDDKFAVVGTFTFMLHRPKSEQLESLIGGRRCLELWVELGTDGSVKVEIFDALDPEHCRKWTRNGEKSERGASGTEVMLGVVIFFLVTLYVTVRVAFNEIDGVDLVEEEVPQAPSKQEF